MPSTSKTEPKLDPMHDINWALNLFQKMIHVIGSCWHSCSVDSNSARCNAPRC
jgi:hypothetical protein